MVNIGQRYDKQGTRKSRHVFFTGSTALKRGMGLCFDRDYGTATAWSGYRDNYVELPTASNNNRFAGVCLQDYAAKTGGQLVEIAEPGSVVDIAVAINTTVNSTYLTCSFNSADAGRFHALGLPGRGSALALQTSTTNQLESDLTGASYLDATGLILTDSAATFSTNGVAAGDTVVFLGIEDDATNYGISAAAAVLATAQTTATVSSVTSENALVLDHAVTNGGTMQCSYYIISGNPTIPALLLDGVESGLCQHRMYTNDGTGDETLTQVGGKFWILGGYTSATSHTAVTIADGQYPGQLYAFECLGAIGGSYDVVVTLTTAGLQKGQAVGGTALASIAFDAAGETAVLQFGIKSWDVLNIYGATQA